MPSDLTQEEREAALATIRTAYWRGETWRPFHEAEQILDAMLAKGWTPEAQPAVQPDARAAAEAMRARIADVVEDALFDDPHGGMVASGRIIDAVLRTPLPPAQPDAIRALSSIPPQEADPT